MFRRAKCSNNYDSSYTEVTVHIVDQHDNDIQIRDPSIVIMLLIKSRSE